jgi:cytochrome c biogenesis protein CcmG, thiol:disulfide interchange protein DsbE
MRWRSLVGLSLMLLVVASTTMAATKKLPSFTLTSLEGKRVKSADLIGDGPLLINFWATWCKPCLAEMPKLLAFSKEWEDKGFRVISVSIDDPRTSKQVKPFVHRQGIKFPVYLDPNQEVLRKLGGRAVPFNVFVSSGGEILSATQGYKDKHAEMWGRLITADVAATPGADVNEAGEGGQEPADGEAKGE